MRKFTNIFIVIFLVVVASVSCNTVHEFPDDKPIDPTSVNVNIEVKIKPIANSNLSNGDITITDFINGGAFPLDISNDYSWHLVLEVYKLDNKNTPVFRKEVTLNTNDMNFVYKESLPFSATKYHVVAWLDHVNAVSKQELYYSVNSGLRKIVLENATNGNTDLKDCFYGGVDFDLTPYRNQWNAEVTIPVEIIRPVAKYILITKDIEEYAAKVKSATPTTASVDANNFSAKITYQGYLPNGFDAYDNLLNDAQTGISQTVNLKVINSKEAIISFDYLLAKLTGSNAIVSIEIFDENKKLINEIKNLTIPLTQGQLTIVRSNFLTKEYKPGIVINPDYDGTIDVVIPD